MLNETTISPNFKRIILFIGIAVMFGGLALFIYLSIYNRYWADDWCYNADFLNKGFLETLRGYFYDTTYTPSRYSVTIFAGLLQVFDTAGTQWMTPLTLIFWMIGLVWLFINIAHLAGLQVDTALMTFFSALIIYFSVYLAPQLYQSLYWRTGLLTYTTPLVLTTWVFALITYQARIASTSRWQTALAGLLALLAGGCSEAAATVLVSSLVMYVGIAWLFRKQPWAQKTLGIAGVSLFFAIVAMCLLIFSPTTQVRSGRYGEPTPLLELPRLIFNYTYSFFVLTIKDYYHILISLISILAGFTYPILQGRSYKFGKYILLDLFIVAVTILLVAAALTPSLYIEKGLPAPRTMIIPDFVAVMGFALGGWVTGSGLREIFHAEWLETGATVLLFVSLAIPLYTIRDASHWIPIYAQRTQQWDAREAIILDALRTGKAEVIVHPIDGLLVGGIRDFDPYGKKGFWINLCARDYYGILLDSVEQ